jgi:hypothetical protein
LFRDRSCLGALNLNFGDWLPSDEAGGWRPRARKEKQESVIVVMKIASPIFEALAACRT